MSNFNRIQISLLSGDTESLLDDVRKCVDEGNEPIAILYEGLIPGMQVVGEKFKSEELYLPEVINIAQNFKMSVGILKPLIMDKSATSNGKVIIGTVEGDMHDVGKNIVVLMLEANGFEVIDLGVNIESAKFIKIATENEADVIGLSALLTTTMPRLGEVIEGLEEAGLKGKIKTIIGGAPINQSYADQIGADAYGHDAIDAVEKIKMLVNKTK